jgi:AcrR family transcriptional regulator
VAAKAKAKPKRRRRQEPRKGDLREQAILDAAETLLEREGVEPVTVEQIANRAGISRAALYFYFASKQDVVASLVARVFEVLDKEAHLAADEIEMTVEETLERAAKGTERQWREHGVAMRLAVEYSPSIPEIDELWRRTARNTAEGMSRLLVRAGVPDDDGPRGARALALALVWMTERNFYMAVTRSEGEPDLEQTTKTVIEIWLRAMSGGS